MYLSSEIENESVRLRLRLMLAEARKKGPLSLAEAVALCEKANKEAQKVEANRGPTEQS